MGFEAVERNPCVDPQRTPVGFVKLANLYRKVPTAARQRDAGVRVVSKPSRKTIKCL